MCTLFPELQVSNCKVSEMPGTLVLLLLLTEWMMMMMMMMMMMVVSFESRQQRRLHLLRHSWESWRTDRSLQNQDNS